MSRNEQESHKKQDETALSPLSKTEEGSQGSSGKLELTVEEFMKDSVQRAEKVLQMAEQNENEQDSLSQVDDKNGMDITIELPEEEDKAGNKSMD